MKKLTNGVWVRLGHWKYILEHQEFPVIVSQAAQSRYPRIFNLGLDVRWLLGRWRQAVGLAFPADADYNSGNVRPLFYFRQVIMLHQFRCLCIVSFLLCAAVLFLSEQLAAQIPQFTEAESIAILENLDFAQANEAEIHKAMLAIRCLQRSGTEKSIIVLEKCLADIRLTTYARAALQNIGNGKSKAAEYVLKKYPLRKHNASPIDKKRSELITKILESKDTAVFISVLKSDAVGFNAALQAFRQYPDRSIIDVLAEEQKILKPEQRIAALYSFLDRKDVEPLPQEIIEAAVGDSNPEVKAAAMKVLGAFPNKERIEILFRECTASAANPEIYEAVIDVLATTKYPEINTAVLAKLSDKDASVRLAAVRVAGERSIKETESALWNIAKEQPFVELQRQAMIALGRIAGKETFEKLCSGYQAGGADNVRGAYLEGIKISCPLSPDQADYVEQISGKIADPLLQLELFALIGGTPSLQAIAKIVSTTKQDAVIDKATQILGEWMSAEVAPVLLDLAASLENEKYKIRCIRGMLRAVRQFDMTKEKKRELCEKALGIATREDEKNLLRQQLEQLK